MPADARHPSPAPPPHWLTEPRAVELYMELWQTPVATLWQDHHVRRSKELPHERFNRRESAAAVMRFAEVGTLGPRLRSPSIATIRGDVDRDARFFAEAAPKVALAVTPLTREGSGAPLSRRWSSTRRVVHGTGRQFGGPFEALLPQRPRPAGRARVSALEHQREHKPQHDDALRAVYGDADERTAVAL